MDKRSNFNLHATSFWLFYLNILFQFNLTTIVVLEFMVVIDVYAQPTREKIKFYRTASHCGRGTRSKGGPQTGGHRRQAEASAHADDPGLQRSRGGDAPEGWENRALRGACDGRGQNADDGWTMSFEELAARCRSAVQ